MAPSTTSGIREIEQEFSGAAFCDGRLAARLPLLANAMAQRPDASFPRALGTAAELEGAYRFLGNTKVTAEEVLRPHVGATVSRIAEQAEVLVAHDSSTVSFTSEGHREGLTPARGEMQSFLLHGSLAIRADGTRPEGVVAFTFHVPTDAEDGSLQERESSPRVGMLARSPVSSPDIRTVAYGGFDDGWLRRGAQRASG